MKTGINKNGNHSNRSGEEMDDMELLRGFAAGDDAITGVLYRKYYVMVLRLVVSNQGTDAEAEDVYQDTMMVLYENAGSGRFVLTSGLQTYVYAVARRIWLKKLRTQGRFSPMKLTESHDVEDAGPQVEAFMEREQDISRMQDSLVKLGEPCATLINDFYVSGLTMEQIADKFGYTNADNAKNQKYKCLQRLKRLFFANAGQKTPTDL